MFSVGCGGTGGGNIFPPPTGNFSNSSLSGQYAYQLSGRSLPSGTIFREAGVFTADGNGHITSGTDDFSQGSSVSSDPITGTYTISNDGTGTAVFNFNQGSISLALTLVSSTKLYMVEGDLFATAAGTAEKQDTTAFNNPPSGTFVFTLHNASSIQGSSSHVGAITVTNGTLVGNEDRNLGGTTSASTLTGLFNFPSTTTGRGTGTFTDSSAATTAFTYYVLDASRFLLFSINTGEPGLGRAERQSAGPFSAASFSGNYAFGSRGDTSFEFNSANTVGRFTASGSGSITNGKLDSVVDGTSTANADFTGTNTVAANGRAAVTLSTTNGTVQQIFWMVSPARAFFFTNSGSVVEDGTADLQTVSTFSNDLMDGQFAIVLDGFDTNGNTFDQIGTLQWDGAGHLTLDQFANVNGVVPPFGLLGGTYSVSGNGRATGSINTISNGFVFYLVSASDAYVLQNDTGVEISGTMSKQP